MSTDSFRYWAFISYSHRDRRWGEWIHRQLESYRVPKRLVGSAGAHGPVPARLFPIFRDREELSTGAKLSEVLDRAIADSRFYIVVCSPNAAASRWVNEEIRLIKRLGRADRILCLIVDGEPYATDAGQPERECFAPALRHEIGPDGELPERAPEPLAADLREGADGRDGARLKLLAGLLGVGYDELRRRDLVARNRRLGIAAGIAGVVAIAMAALTVRAVFAERAAEKSRQQGEELIGFMLGDLRGKLEPLGKLDILDAVGDQAMAYFAQLDRRKLSEAQLVSRAKALRQIGDVRLQQGRSAEAANSFDAALVLNRELAARKPADSDLQFELAQAEFWVGYAALQADQLDRAQGHFEAYKHVAAELVRRDPTNSLWQLEDSYAESNLGTLASFQLKHEVALVHFQKAAELARAVRPSTNETLETVANALSWQGSELQALGRADDALAAMAEQVEQFRKLSSDNPGDMLQLEKLAKSLSAYELVLVNNGRADSSERLARDGIAICLRLIANDPSNRTYREMLARHHDAHARSLSLLGRYADALFASRRTEHLTEMLVRENPDDFDSRTLLISSIDLSFNLAMTLRDEAQAQELAALAASAAAPSCASSAVAAPRTQLLCARAQLVLLERDPQNARAQELLRVILKRTFAQGDKALLDTLRFRADVLNRRAPEGAIQDAPELPPRPPPELELFRRRHCRAGHGQPSSASCTVY